MSRFNTLLLETGDDGVAVLTVNRPDKMNALNDEVLTELAEAFRHINVEKSIRAVIVTGAGEKAFVAGADIGELSQLDERSGRMFSQRGQQIFQSIEDTRKPVIAAVNGYALGGGTELAMACHIRLASSNAVFGLPEVGLGVIPGYGGTQRLSRLAGHARALELVLTGRHVKAEEAERIGLVNRVVDRDVLVAARDLVGKIMKNGPLAVRKAIQAIYHSDSKNGFQVEADLFGTLCNSDDFREGTSAFLEKRKPDFKGT